MAPGESSRQRGYAFVMVMALVALLALALSHIGPVWVDDARRDREQELLRVGGLYAQAIQDYRAASPGSLKSWPPRLEDLLLDKRFVGTRRHLRNLYPDPLAPGRPWGLIKAPDGGIQGVYSQDTREPFRRGLVELPAATLNPARRYDDWIFIPRTNS